MCEEKKSFGHLLFHLEKKPITFSLACSWNLRKGKGSFTQLLPPPFTLGWVILLSPSWCKSFSGLGAIKLKGEVDSCRSMLLLELLTYSTLSDVHVQPYFLLFHRIKHRSGQWCCLPLKLYSLTSSQIEHQSTWWRVYRLIKFSNLQRST